MTGPHRSSRALVRRTPLGVPYAAPTPLPNPSLPAVAEPRPQPRSGHDGPPEPTPADKTDRRAKLTEDDVRAIRADYAAGRWGIKDLADIYGVTQPTMSAVVHRRTWRHVTDQPTEGN
ncbi:hypothetical protein [Mycolicibacter sinensis]|uniref:hypothetical protein n=1 Tax=Mycolicibacter sinensis (strain JDM601) TaxID=875328 RepID=UPI0007EC1560|nr:hypothetical protein [Mycolicibacter sinensis]OBH17054.1 hypothetical protein A5694_04865 [Mycolicibacter sinensis]